MTESTMPMSGKCVLITGGNSGIGLVTAKVLAASGARVLIAGRDGAKTDAALALINEAAAIPCTHLTVDLTSLASVDHLIDEASSIAPSIDVLINNAGCFPMKGGLTSDGFEQQFGVNHLAHMKLTLGLMPQLRAAPAARVITVASMLHKQGSIDPASFTDISKYKAQAAYNQSKLANVLFALALSRRLSGSSVTSNVLHPGGVRTDIVRDLPWIVRKLIGLIFISPEKGAETTIMLASDPGLEGVSGRYYDQCKLKAPAESAIDEHLQETLWQQSLELLHLDEPDWG